MREIIFAILCVTILSCDDGESRVQNSKYDKTSNNLLQDTVLHNVKVEMAVNELVECNCLKYNIHTEKDEKTAISLFNTIFRASDKDISATDKTMLLIFLKNYCYEISNLFNGLVSAKFEDSLYLFGDNLVYALPQLGYIQDIPSQETLESIDSSILQKKINAIELPYRKLYNATFKNLMKKKRREEFMSNKILIDGIVNLIFEDQTFVSRNKKYIDAFEKGK